MIHIYNAYTMVELTKIHADSPKIIDLVFADLDKAFAALGVNGYIGKWSLPTFDKIHESRPENKEEIDFTDFRAIDFVPNPVQLVSS